MERDITIHVGYSKTGTTFLQKSVFPHLKEVRYIDNVKTKKLFYEVLVLDKLDINIEKLEADLGKLSPINNKLFLSQEQLTGSALFNIGCNRSATAEVLKTIGVNKIVFTIRNQYKVIESLYRQYVHEGGVLSYNEFLNFEDSFNKRNPSFNWGYYNYFPLIKYYMDLFGKENVLVICNEDLRNDYKSIATQLAEFIGCSIEIEKVIPRKDNNKSLSNLSLSLLRKMNLLTSNRFKPKSLIHPKFTSFQSRKLLERTIEVWLSPKSQSLNDNEIQNKILNYYSKANQDLSELLGYDLAKLGYPS